MLASVFQYPILTAKWNGSFSQANGLLACRSHRVINLISRNSSSLQINYNNMNSKRADVPAGICCKKIQHTFGFHISFILRGNSLQRQNAMIHEIVVWCFELWCYSLMKRSSQKRIKQTARKLFYFHWLLVTQGYTMIWHGLYPMKYAEIHVLLLFYFICESVIQVIDVTLAPLRLALLIAPVHLKWCWII